MLVALIVVVVPELLSGPKPAGHPSAASADAVRTYTVDLADKLPATATAASDSMSAGGQPPASQAVPAVSGANPGTPADAPTAPAGLPAAPSATAADSTPSGKGFSSADSGDERPAHVLPAAKPPPRAVAPPDTVESPAPSPLSAMTKPSHGGAGGWTVQLGSFASEENADKLAHQLKVQGYPVYVLSSGSGAMLRHRVRMGPLPDRDAAQRLVAKLKAQGQPATLVPP